MEKYKVLACYIGEVDLDKEFEIVIEVIKC